MTVEYLQQTRERKETKTHANHLNYVSFSGNLTSIHQFGTELLSACYLPGTVPNTMYSCDQVRTLVFMGLTISLFVRWILKKHTNKYTVTDCSKCRTVKEQETMKNSNFEAPSSIRGRGKPFQKVTVTMTYRLRRN